MQVERTYSQADREAVERCLLAVQHQSEKRQHEGLSKHTFALGVLNALFVAWTQGAYPEHFWLVYVLETLILFPARWVIMGRTKPLNERPFWFDFCWFANFSAFAILIFAAVDHMFGDPHRHHQLRQQLFCTAWAIGCGILACAAGILGNALVFHDASNLVSLFIHLFPTMLMYTIRHNAAAMTAAWPGVFSLDYFDAVHPWKDIYLSGVMFYAFWWVIYTAMLLTFLLKLPERGYDTIFHFTMRTNPTAAALVAKIAVKLGAKNETPEDTKRRMRDNDWERIHAFGYMLAHGCACMAALLLAVPTWQFWQVHAALNFFLVASCVENGAARYSHYMLRSYSDIIRKELHLGSGEKVPTENKAELSASLLA